MAKQPYPNTLVSARLVAEAEKGSRRNNLALSLAALGVVYGDIGTSPLYSFRECLAPERAGVTPTTDHVFSVLSLIFWSLTLVVVVKYLFVVMRADNHGEGGILALLALLIDHEDVDDSAGAPRLKLSTRASILLGILGTCLLLADGMITPAISVLSAMEGIQVAVPDLGKLVVPVTVAILAGLFLVQRFGTVRIAGFFGPIMCLWFVTIALIGVPWIVRCPEVLAAVDPRMPSTCSSPSPCVAYCCWARSFFASPAPRRCTPTWGILDASRFAWPGMPSSSHP